MSKIALYYWKSNRSIYGNFGDTLSNVIVKKLSKDKIKSVYDYKKGEKYEKRLLGIGSIIHLAKDDDIIWGSGIRTLEANYNFKKLDVKAVRGPITKKFLEKKNVNCPNIFGDPGILYPKLFPNLKPVIKTNKFGVLPHFTQIDKYDYLKSKKDIVLISPLDHHETIINKIQNSKLIISSSLHGLVLADAYNIPNYWLYEHELNEGKLKFYDYLQSQNRSINCYKSVDDILKSNSSEYGNKLDLDLLIKSFPFYN